MPFPSVRVVTARYRERGQVPRNTLPRYQEKGNYEPREVGAWDNSSLMHQEKDTLSSHERPLNTSALISFASPRPSPFRKATRGQSWHDHFRYHTVFKGARNSGKQKKKTITSLLVVTAATAVRHPPPTTDNPILKTFPSTACPTTPYVTFQQ